ncbi:hypothetical protein [Blastopirellula marina]|uniref:hypothetical protein n=1 Tax=Blastopirellula marina TaxID=124 RepID=UPI001304C84F|nr:hypothetical protein [Blastopirellula marina]
MKRTEQAWHLHRIQVLNLPEQTHDLTEGLVVERCALKDSDFLDRTPKFHGDSSTALDVFLYTPSIYIVSGGLD